MALPISPGELIELAKFAYKLWVSCKTAKGQFEQIGREVLAMRTAIELANLNLQDPNIVKIAGSKESKIWQDWRNHIRNCKQALSDVEALLRRYKNMSLLDRVAWALHGGNEVAGLEANLTSFASQLDRFVNNLALRGIGILGAQLSRLRCKIGRLGRIEEELEKNDGDDDAAVRSIMRDMKGAGISHDTANHLTKIFSDYAQEVSRSETTQYEQRSPTPDPPREGQRRLSAPNLGHRSRSADASKPGNDRKARQVPFKKWTGPNRPKYALECWLIQIQAADAIFLNIKKYIKEKQVRGQWKLEQMAKQFQSCSKASRLANDDELVSWVLTDRKKAEEDPNYTWRPYSAKIERKSSIFLGLGIEEQAMVIIKRQMTKEAQKRADEEARIKAEKVAASKKKQAEETAKKLAKESAEHKVARAQKIKEELEQERKKEKGKGKGGRDDQKARQDKGQANAKQEEKRGKKTEGKASS